MNFVVNKHNCLSVRKVGSLEQCPNKRKENSDLCGIHKRAKKVVYVTTLKEYGGTVDVSCNSTELKHYDKKYLMCRFTCDDAINPFIFSMRNKSGVVSLSKIKDLKVTRLRETLKKYNLTEIIQKNQSKQCIFNALINYFYWIKWYNDNVDSIIRVQSLVRRYHILKRVKTVNDTECISMISKFDIPTMYYIDLKDSISNKYYAFDVRQLSKILNNGKVSVNPYTLNVLDDSEIDKVNDRINYLNNHGFNCMVDKDEITEDEELVFKTIDTFHKIDMVGNYTDHTWFTELSIYELKDLYNKSEDMVNYRINLPADERKKYFHNGIAFPLSSQIIMQMKDEKKLRKLILKEYNEILDFNNELGDKKTAVMWLLIALTEVSQNARNALPMLNMDM